MPFEASYDKLAMASWWIICMCPLHRLKSKNLNLSSKSTCQKSTISREAHILCKSTWYFLGVYDFLCLQRYRPQKRILSKSDYILLLRADTKIYNLFAILFYEYYVHAKLYRLLISVPSYRYLFFHCRLSIYYLQCWLSCLQCREA